MLPDAHDGEIVVEPGMANGADIDFAGAKTYAKEATIKAVRMETRFHVLTAHGRVLGERGDWLGMNPATGERWPIRASDMESTYQEVDPQ